MGAFFLFHKDTEVDERKVLKLYERKGFQDPIRIQLGKYTLLLYQKILVKSTNYLQSRETCICVCGSLFYKKKGFENSLKQLSEDIGNDNLKREELFGNYAIFYFNLKEEIIRFFVDPSFIKGIYCDLESRILTTNFLALIAASPREYTLNRLAILENMMTGHLISPDTYIHQIQKLDKENFSLIDTHFPGIKKIKIEPDAIDEIPDRIAAIKHANALIGKYFAGMSGLAGEFGAHLGLTGGLDSRLLLIHARKHLDKLITNSFWRENSPDYVIAKVLSEKAQLDFISFEDKSFQSKNQTEMIEDAYWFFDGQVRSQNNWNEAFNNPEYAAKIAGQHFVGIHGSGGEQYRNADRLIGRIGLDQYVYYEWMFKQSSDVFSDKELKYEVHERIRKKIKRLVSIPGNKIGLLELKKIQNEIYNTANRTTRVNVLNQQQFYFAPFTESQLSLAAYRYVPFLGKSISFQLEMMRRSDSLLASINTNYGFSILNGEPCRYRMLPYMIKMMPRKWYRAMYHRIKKFQIKEKRAGLFSAESNHVFRELGSKINLDALVQNRNLEQCVRSLDYFVKRTGLH